MSASRQLIDAILHIASVPDLVAWFAANAPAHLSQDDDGLITQPETIVGFDRTPTVIAADGQGLAYVRVTEEDAAAWQSTPGVTILAQALYADGVQDTVYAALFADTAMTALYDQVYSRAPYQVPDGAGGTMQIIPPDRFGQMA